MTEYKFQKKPQEMKTGTATLVDPGPYAFEVTFAEAVAKPSSPDGYLRIRYKVVSPGAFEGDEPFPDQLSLADSAQWKMAEFCCAIFPDMPEGFDIDELTKNLKGKRVIATTFHKEWEGDTRNTYKNYRVCNEEEMKSISGTSSGTPSASTTDTGKKEVAKPSVWR